MPWLEAVVVALAAVGLMGLLVDGAVARKAAKSTVAISSGRDSQFTGKVASGTKQCRAGRTVKLYLEGGFRDRAGTHRCGADWSPAAQY